MNAANKCLAVRGQSRLSPFSRRSWILLASGAAAAQAPIDVSPPKKEQAPVGFLCPMDKDIRSARPGKCPRCGMALVANLPDPVEYGLNIVASPAAFRAGRPVTLDFEVLHPSTGKRVREFEIVHEQPFHLFLISQDLEYFAHEHPKPLADGRYRFKTVLPRAVPYRVVCDFFPTGGTVQFLTRTLIAAGTPIEAISRVPELVPALAAQKGANIEVELAVEPARPIAGQEALMFFRVKPDDGLEQYLGAWGHMLAGSADLIDLVHEHPLYITRMQGMRQIQFNLLFPRAGMYRLWVQFQRKGVVNTVQFTVPVKTLG
jgi:hypothetical protein